MGGQLEICGEGFIAFGAGVDRVGVGPFHVGYQAALAGESGSATGNGAGERAKT